MDAFRRAQGYHELGMHPDAWHQLETLPARIRSDLPATLLQLSVLQALQRWATAADLARQAVASHAHCRELYLMGAYAIRRAVNVPTAREFLVSGAHCLRDEPSYHFNLGCYHCLMGDLATAQVCIEHAVVIDPGFKHLAIKDPDLSPLHGILRREYGFG